MSELYIVDNLVYQQDPTQQLTSDELRATTIVSLFGTDEQDFQIAVDEGNFDTKEFLSFIDSQEIDCQSYTSNKLEELPISSKYSKTEIQGKGFQIKNILCIQGEKFPSEAIVLLILKKNNFSDKLILLGQHIISED